LRKKRVIIGNVCTSAQNMYVYQNAFVYTQSACVCTLEECASLCACLCICVCVRICSRRCVLRACAQLRKLHETHTVFMRKQVNVCIRKLVCVFTAHARINKSCASVSACLCANDPVRNIGSVLPTKSSRACTATCVYTQTDLCIHAPFVLARAVRAHVRVCVCV